MNQTLADVIIPTFDIKLIQPMVFSTSDVCRFLMIPAIFEF